MVNKLSNNYCGKIDALYGKEAKMYASIRRYEGAGNIEEVVRAVKEGFLPILRNVPGFVAYYALDIRYGVAITISIYEDEVGAVEAERLAEKWVRESLASTFPNPVEVTSGEVVVYDFAKPG